MGRGGKAYFFGTKGLEECIGVCRLFINSFQTKLITTFVLWGLGWRRLPALKHAQFQTTGKLLHYSNCFEETKNSIPEGCWF